jgi:SAM-dependent methyltransferase
MTEAPRTMTATSDAYDAVAYPTHPQAYAFPAALGALAALCGLRGAPAYGYAALEIGCGSGEHLFAAAIDAPDSRFEGIDLSRAAVERGEALRREAGLDNARLRVADLAAIEVASGAMDYVVAHGVYSWTRPSTREALLGLIARALSPTGVAAVSFNVLPGCALRRALRDLVRPRLVDLPPAARFAAARAGLECARDEATDEATRAEAAFLLGRDPQVLFHDEFAEVYAPTTFSDFVAAAGDHGLVCLCDAAPATLAQAWRPRPQNEWEIDESRRDETERTRFRRMLLARRQALPERGFQPRALRGLHACADLSADPEAQGVWRVANGGRIGSDDLATARWLSALAERGDDGLPLDDLSERLDDRVEALLSLAVAGVVEIRTRPRGAPNVGDGARAHSLARAQLRKGERALSTLRGGAAVLDERLRELLRALDGRASLAEAGAAARLSLVGAREEVATFARMGLLAPGPR